MGEKIEILSSYVQVLHITSNGHFTSLSGRERKECTKMSNASAGCAEGTANAIIKSIVFNGGYFAYYQTVKA